MSFGTAFPNLEVEGYEISSPYDRRYNCIAWASSRDNQWSWPGGGGYWPAGVSDDTTVEAFIEAFALQGYETCDDRILDAGYGKVALYAQQGEVTHAARQLSDGRWTSKLGKEVDITHTLAGLEGPCYGVVVQILRRPNPDV
jgi:hypothetical protein